MNTPFTALSLPRIRSRRAHISAINPILLLVLAIGMSVNAGAVTIYDTTPSWDNVNAISPFGFPDTATFGQTFVAPATDVILNSFTFYLDVPDGTAVQFKGMLFDWSGSLFGGGGGQATGPALFQSSSITANGDDAFDPETVNTGGLELVAGGAYVALFTVSDTPDYNGSTGTAQWGNIISHVANNGGGGFVFYNTGGDVTLINTSQWDNFADNGDSAWKAEFAAPTAVPEPRSFQLAALSILALLARGQCKRSRRSVSRRNASFLFAVPVAVIIAGCLAVPQEAKADCPPGICCSTNTINGFVHAPAGTSILVTVDCLSLNSAMSSYSATNGPAGGFSCVGLTKESSFYTTGSDNEPFVWMWTTSSSASVGFSNGIVASPKNMGCPVSSANPGSVCGNPVNVATGNKLQIETDYIGGASTHLELRRYYNSAAAVGRSRFGQKWHATYDRSVQNTQGRSYALVARADGRIDQFRLQNGTWVADADVTSTLTALQNGGVQTLWQVVTSDDTIEIYNLAGQLLSITTRSGLTTTLTYDGSGQLATVTGPFGHRLTFSYNTTGQVNQMTAPDGGVYAYAYDSKGNLSAVTHPDATIRQYVYENTSFPNALTGIIDELSNRFATYAYDSQGRATSTQHAGGAELTRVTYNSNGSASVTDARGNAHTYTFQTQFGVVKPTALTGAPVQTSGGRAFTFDANGFVARRTDWDGNVTTYTHDSRGQETSRVEASGTALARTITTAWLSTFHLPTSITEPNRTTTFTYDTHGNVLTKTMTAPGVSRTWIYTYNANGQVLTATLRRTDLSDITKYSYDGKGNLATITNPLGHVTSITAYDANGRPLTIVDPNGLVTTLTYDRRGRLTARTVGTEVTSYMYDAVGNLTKVTLPDASFLSYSYDQSHRLTGVTDALGNSIAYTLDAADNRTLEQVFDPTNSLTRTRSYAYDLVNRLIQAVGAQGQTSSYTYDTQGNLTKVTDPLNHATSYSYDALNRLATALDPNNGNSTYGYNANDDLTSVTDPRGLTTSYHCCPAKLFWFRISLVESAGYGGFWIFRFEGFQI